MAFLTVVRVKSPYCLFSVLRKMKTEAMITLGVELAVASTRVPKPCRVSGCGTARALLLPDGI